MPTSDLSLPANVYNDALTLWNYHRLDHRLRPVDVAIGLGSHDEGVPAYTARLYQLGLFPLVVFTGANAPTTVELFPRGEAVHYREVAIQQGVPPEAILVEDRATNTGENITFSRELLADQGIEPRSALITSRPYQQRRAYATAKMLWPDIELLCSAEPQTLSAYMAGVGDAARVINMLVGDTQRIWLYAARGYAIHQELPEQVITAYTHLVERGYTQRLIIDG